tara:strand:- start:10441 stop:11667 length:1227 start_codon:yes stop_codon:yes gene_type:complete
MSQRQVNLKGGDITSMYTSAVSDITKTVGNIQEKRRARSKQAILNANKTTEDLVKTYNKQTTSTDSQLNTALNKYVREQAELIGNAKFRAQRPGATDEDREKFKVAEAQGKANLDAIAKWSVLTEQNGEAYTKHASSLENGTMLYSLSTDALNNDELIGFETALLSNQTKGVEIKTGGNNGPEVIVIGEDDTQYTRNIFSDVQAFTQTGGTLSEQSVSDNELLDGAVYKKWDKEFFSTWGLQPTKTIYKSTKTETEGGDKTTETTTTTTKDYVKNIAKTVLDEHRPWFEKTISSGFNKNWDQLVGLDLVPDDTKFIPMKKISWNTLHNPDPAQGLENLKEQFSNATLNTLDQDGKPGFTEDDYNMLQKLQDEAAIIGLANLVAFKKGGEYAKGGFTEETGKIVLARPY